MERTLIMLSLPSQSLDFTCVREYEFWFCNCFLLLWYSISTCFSKFKKSNDLINCRHICTDHHLLCSWVPLWVFRFWTGVYKAKIWKQISVEQMLLRMRIDNNVYLGKSAWISMTANCLPTSLSFIWGWWWRLHHLMKIKTLILFIKLL